MNLLTSSVPIQSFRSSHNLKEISGLVKRFMVDILASLVNDPESISDELIESMKEFLVGRDDCQVLQTSYIIFLNEKPRSNSNRKCSPFADETAFQIGTQLCREVISKASDGLESHMDRFFRTELGHESVQMMYDLFVELYSIIPQNLTCFLLQLDSKLESKHDNVRLEVSVPKFRLPIR